MKLGSCYHPLKIRLDAEHVAYSLLVEEVASIEKQIEEVKKEHAEYRENLQALRKEEPSGEGDAQQFEKNNF